METVHQNFKRFTGKPWFPYVLPFLLFLLLTEPGRFFPASVSFLYTIKTILVGTMLWRWRHTFKADFSSVLSWSACLESLFCGLLVLAIWIVPEDYFFKVGQGAGFDPYALGGSQAAALILITIRMVGSSLVVPVMEELFWRSFVMRYLIDPDFRSVKIGTFSWYSFLGVAILFGLEHHRVVVGIVAGLLYGLLLIRQKNLKGVILAHMVTNLGLGIYVVTTGHWAFW